MVISHNTDISMNTNQINFAVLSMYAIHSSPQLCLNKRQDSRDWSPKAPKILKELKKNHEGNSRNPSSLNLKSCNS